MNPPNHTGTGFAANKKVHSIRSNGLVASRPMALPTAVRTASGYLGISQLSLAPQTTMLNFRFCYLLLNTVWWPMSSTLRQLFGKLTNKKVGSHMPPTFSESPMYTVNNGTQPSVSSTIPLASNLDFYLLCTKSRDKLPAPFLIISTTAFEQLGYRSQVPHFAYRQNQVSSYTAFKSFSTFFSFISTICSRNRSKLDSLSGSGHVTCGISRIFEMKISDT